MREATKIVFQAIMDELEALKGERDATKTADKAEWWREIEWAIDDNRTVFDALPEETRNLIIEAGLCPECDKEEEGCEEGYKKNEEGECVKMEEKKEGETNPNEDEDTPDTTLTDVDKKEESKKVALDPYEVMKTADKLLNP